MHPWSESYSVSFLFQVKSVKPILKQLQQSIQTITQIHTEDGKTVGFIFSATDPYLPLLFPFPRKAHINVGIFSDVV